MAVLVSFTRLFQLLALAAMLLTPLGMHKAAAAAPAAHHAEEAMPAGHCGGSDEAPHDRNDGAAVECALGCSAIAGASAALPADAAPPAPYLAAPAPFFAGTAPGADPPPPRRP